MKLPMLGLAVSGTILFGTLALPSSAAAEEAYKPSVHVDTILKTTTTADGAPIHYPDIADPEVQTLLIEIPAGGETGWHVHPFPLYAYLMAGRLEVTDAQGAKRVFKAGDSFAELVGEKHNGRVLGDQPVRILVVVTGEKGKPFTVKTSAPD